jgi:UDP-N-acetylglucosamine 2-epimerase
MNRIITIVGTRPELIKLSRVIAELDKYTDHILIHTGQNYDYELNEIFFNGMYIRKPDYFMEAAGKNASETIANVIRASDEYFESLKPDAVLIYGDTNSCLSVIPAKRLKIPIFHMEAGNRCFDQRVPEEINRKIVDHLSDINMPLSEHARRYLIAEGIKPETVIKTGSPMAEVLHYHLDDIKNSEILKKLKLKKKSYFLVSMHREENIDSPFNFSDIIESLSSLATVYNKRIIISTHPRTRKKLEKAVDTSINPLISFLKPFGFHDYINLQMNAYCVLSDSGTITEECSILGFPAITIRQAHERPEGMDKGTLIMSGLKKENVLDAVKVVTGQAYEDKFKPEIAEDYTELNVSSKVVRIILSYIEYVNRTVWFKS